MKNKVSVVIPTYNEIDYLPNLIHCLEKQTFKDFTIVVVDNHSTDGTREFCKKKNIFLVNGGHPSKSRNIGVNLFFSEYILFLDADVLIDQTFIEKALKSMDNLQADLISFLFQPNTNNNVIYTIHKIVSFYFKLTNVLGFSHGVGGALLVKRQIHLLVNGFDETITVAEDQDYIRKISKMHKYYFLKEPKVRLSARRFIKEGIFNLSLKWLQIEFYRIFFGEVRNNYIKYF